MDLAIGERGVFGGGGKVGSEGTGGAWEGDLLVSGVGVMDLLDNLLRIPCLAGVGGGGGGGDAGASPPLLAHEGPRLCFRLWTLLNKEVGDDWCGFCAKVMGPSWLGWEA